MPTPSKQLLRLRRPGAKAMVDIMIYPHRTRRGFLCFAEEGTIKMRCPVGNGEKIQNIFETKASIPSYKISTNHEVETNNKGK